MELLLLKSSACLLALLVFYKITLESLSIHKFKRVYLIFAVLVAAIIPFITFIKYVDPTYNFGTFDPNSAGTPPYFPAELPAIIKKETVNYLPTILWSIYALGASLFLIRFCVNLFGLVSKIRNHTKVKSNRFVNVLMEQLEVPHTFFNFIFLNKNKYENNQIPSEVILHEQTHAKQKHSLDILFIEVLQVVFWFNPLLYWLKKEVKLNHEFLADQAVLNQGIDTKNYQNILLQFSSKQHHLALANAINYSSIKKRFTLMKTQTSKPTVWLRSLLLLPLLAILLFSFSQTKEVEKEVEPKIKIDKSQTPAMLFENENKLDEALNNSVKEVTEQLEKADALKINYTARSIDIKVYKDGTYKIDGIKANKSTFVQVINQLHQDITHETRNNIINIHVDSPKEISDKEVWFIYNAVQDYGFHRIVAYNQEVIRSKGNTPFALEAQDGATKKQVAEYNAWAKKINSKTVNLANNTKLLPIVEEKNLIKYIDIYKRMTMEQKEHSEKMPFDNIELKNALKESVDQVSNKNSLENQDTKLLVNGIECDNCTLNLSKKGALNMILSTSSKDKIISFNFKIPKKPTQRNKGNSLNETTKKLISEIKNGVLLQVFHIKTETGQELGHFKIKIVDKKDKNYSSSPIVKKGDDSSIPPPTTKLIIEQRKKEAKEYAKKHPEKVSKTTLENGEVIEIVEVPAKEEVINGETYQYYFDQNGVKKYFPPAPPAPLTPPKENTSERSKKQEAIKAEMQTRRTEMQAKRQEQMEARRAKINEKRKVRMESIPPAPKSPIDHIVAMAKKDATFYYNGKEITSDKAIALVKKNKHLNISSNTNNGVSIVHLSEKGIKTKNGKLVED